MIDELEQVTWQKGTEIDGLPNHVRLGFDPGSEGLAAPFYHCKQVHGARVVVVGGGDGPDQILLTEADALVSDQAGLTVAVKTADCLPILMWGKRRRWVAAVHAGWRGFAAGVVGTAMTHYLSDSSDFSELHCAVGPAISGNHYEVGPEVVQAIAGGECPLTREQLLLGLLKGAADRWYVDLPILAACALISHGVPPSNIAVVRHCTFTSPRYHSFRREGRRMRSNYSWIRLENDS